MGFGPSSKGEVHPSYPLRKNGGPWVSLANAWAFGTLRLRFKSGRAHLQFLLLHDGSPAEFLTT